MGSAFADSQGDYSMLMAMVKNLVCIIEGRIVELQDCGENLGWQDFLPSTYSAVNNFIILDIGDIRAFAIVVVADAGHWDMVDIGTGELTMVLAGRMSSDFRNEVADLNIINNRVEDS